MTDDLDTKTDAQLSEIFAVEVAGWKRAFIKKRNGWVSEKGFAPLPPLFAEDANDVLPWLEKNYEVHINYADRPFGENFVSQYSDAWHYTVTVWPKHDERGWQGEAKTFARAACIALIRSKRSEK